jgi:hypothetical protein
MDPMQQKCIWVVENSWKPTSIIVKRGGGASMKVGVDQPRSFKKATKQHNWMVIHFFSLWY